MFTENIIQEMIQPIIVVGNGMPSMNFGNFVDQHKTIVRFNNAKIEGFEKLIGSKTSHWCVNGNSRIRKSFPLEPFSPLHKDHFDEGILRIFKHNVGCEPVFAENPWYNWSGLSDPTIGFLLCYMFAAMDIKIDVICFDGLKTAHYWDLKHRHAKGHLEQADVELEWISDQPSINVYE